MWRTAVFFQSKGNNTLISSFYNNNEFSTGEGIRASDDTPTQPPPVSDFFGFLISYDFFEGRPRRGGETTGSSRSGSTKAGLSRSTEIVSSLPP